MMNGYEYTGMDAILGAVQMDDTGTTRIGKWVFNHAFFLPGVLAIVFSVALGFAACALF